MMIRVLASAALIVAGLGFATTGAGRAQADPAMCQFLGTNYNVQYPCDQYQPWLPYGTGNNPPLGGSAVQPGGDGPSGGYHWQPNSPACPACSS
jgi:hypothetical protein